MPGRTNLQKIKDDLGANYRNDDNDVLQDILSEVSSIASDISNNFDEEKLFPYIKKAVKAIYLSRGSEGMQSRGEGSISSSYEDAIEELRNNIIKNGLRRLK